MLETLDQVLTKREMAKVRSLLKAAKESKTSGDYNKLKLFLIDRNEIFKKHNLDGANVAWSLLNQR